VFDTAVDYEKQAEYLKEKLVKELESSIESIILYGSVARKQAHEDSDIDILIVTINLDKKLYNRISKIRTETDMENDTFTTLVQMSKTEFEQNLKLDSPFIENVLKEGVTLYDRGFIEKIRRSVTPKSYKSIKVS
jgi:predicted nucleotidyltransferase